MTSKSAYKNIIKSISLFGGVQVIQVFATLIRGKLIAVFLGPAGMGLSSLLVSSISTVQIIFGLGLDFSAVREISQANETGNQYKISRTISVFIEWLLFSALFGALMLIIIAPWLSSFVFGNINYTPSFKWLSIVIAVNTLGAGCQSLLQGMHRLKDMAKASIIGSIFSVIITFPIYYFLRIQGVVPAIILVAISTFLINYSFVRKIKFEKEKIGLKEKVIEGSVMLKLGIARMIAGLLGALAALLINAFIKNTGSLSDVGLYQAGLGISNQYVGIIFTAIAIDYFPRLAAVNSDSKRVNEIVNQQSEIMLLIISPLLVMMILSAPLIIRVLLTDEFQPIINFVRLISIGVFFGAAKQSMDLISFAKGDSKTFLLLAITGSFLLLFFSILGYTLNGLFGIAQMFIVHNIICFFLIYFVAHKKYNYIMSSSFSKLIIISAFPIVLSSTLLIANSNFIGYIIGSILLFASILFSIYYLNKLIGLKESYTNFISNYFKK